MSLFELPPLPDPGPVERLSAGRRLTIRNNGLLAAGIHPATRVPLAGTDETCGSCVHHHAYDYHNGRFHKCDLHGLGESHSAASDVRVSWPAGTRWEAP